MAIERYDLSFRIIKERGPSFQQKRELYQ